MRRRTAEQIVPTLGGSFDVINGNRSDNNKWHGRLYFSRKKVSRGVLAPDLCPMTKVGLGTSRLTYLIHKPAIMPACDRIEQGPKSRQSGNLVHFAATIVKSSLKTSLSMLSLIAR